MCGSREWYLGVVSFRAWMALILSYASTNIRLTATAAQYTAYRHCCFHSLCVCLSIRRDEGSAVFSLLGMETRHDR